jgi:hypothetical protein
MHLKDPVEILYLSLMHRWWKTAPPDSHERHLDGEIARNTQITRFAYLLQKVAAGKNEDHIYQTLARYTRRNDGESYISQDPFVDATALGIERTLVL